MKVRILRLSGRIWLIVCFVIIFAGIGVGLATRMSYTDFNAQSNDLTNLEYRYIPANSQAVDLSFDKTHNDNKLDIEGLFNEAPIIVRGVFEGDRTYAYQTFVSKVRVTQVYRGDGIFARQVISIFEPVAIEKDSRFTDVAQAPYVMRPASGAPTIYDQGGTPMRSGQEYLFFLLPKAYPGVEDRSGKPQEYLMEDSPYARIAIPADRSMSDVGILNSQTDFLTFGEVQNYSFIIDGAPSSSVPDRNAADDVNLYCATRDSVIRRVESLQP